MQADTVYVVVVGVTGVAGSLYGVAVGCLIALAFVTVWYRAGSSR